MSLTTKVAGLGLFLLMPALLVTAQAQDKKPDDKQVVKKDEAKVEPKADQPPDTTADDQKALKDVGVSSDGPSLLEYFKKRTFADADPKQVEKLIKDMGDDDFETREAAFGQLTKLGSSALGRLKLVVQEKGQDTEVLRRAQELVQRIEEKAQPSVQAATARLIAKTKPAGAADVILAYLPFAADHNVTVELC
jgi:hypothetical protein